MVWVLSMNKQAVLFVVANEPIGGVGSYILTLCNALKDKYRFIIAESVPNGLGDFSTEFLNTNPDNKIVQLPNLKITNIFTYLRTVRKMYSKLGSEIDIVHVHAPNLAIVHLYYAKKFSVKVRILQFHSTKYSASKIKATRNKILIWLSRIFVTRFAATSEESARVLSKTVKSVVAVLPNTIQPRKFQFNNTKRSLWRTKLDIKDNEIVIGNVANFLPGKNQQFIVDSIKNSNLKKRVKIIFVGDGPLLGKVKQDVDVNGLQNRVLFLGRRNDVQDIYSAFDVFVMPSEFEGFSRVVLEAQINGLPCVVSQGIPRSVVLDKDAVKYVMDNKMWSKNISEMVDKYGDITFHSRGMGTKFEDSHFTQVNLVNKLTELYTTDK